MKKVLVVDDDPDILEAVQMVLVSGGYESEVLAKADELYSKVQTYKPDIIILDVLLSGSDGRILCKKLKNDEETAHIPILMFSAHPKAKEMVKEIGADGFISKPFSVKELLAEVKKYA